MVHGETGKSASRKTITMDFASMDDESIYTSIVLKKVDEFQKKVAHAEQGKFAGESGSTRCLSITNEGCCESREEEPIETAIELEKDVHTKQNCTGERESKNGGKEEQNIINLQYKVDPMLEKEKVPEPDKLNFRINEARKICAQTEDVICDDSFENSEVVDDSNEVDDLSIGRLLIAIEAAALRLYSKAMKAWKHFTEFERKKRERKKVLFQTFKTICINRASIRRTTRAWYHEATASAATKKALGIIDAVVDPSLCSEGACVIGTNTGYAFKRSMKETKGKERWIEEKNTESTDRLRACSEAAQIPYHQFEGESSQSSATKSKTEEKGSPSLERGPKKSSAAILVRDETFLKKQHSRDVEARRRREARHARDANRKKRQEEQDHERRVAEQRLINEERLLKAAAQMERQERRREEERRVQARRDLLKCQLELSKLHHNRARLLYNGLLPWLKLHQQFESQLIFARKFYSKRLFAQSFCLWRKEHRRSKQKPVLFIKKRFLFLWLSIMTENRKTRLCHALVALQQNVQTERSLERTAKRMAERRTMVPHFRKWIDFRMISVLERETASLMEVCFRAFSQWKIFATEEKQKRTDEDKRARVLRKAEDLIRRFREENNESLQNVTNKTRAFSKSQSSLSSGEGILTPSMKSQVMHKHSFINVDILKKP